MAMVGWLDCNVPTADGRYLCPACGFPAYEHDPPYSEFGGRSQICPCCLWEPGYDDDPLASRHASASLLESLTKYRERWAATFAWQSHSLPRPPNWDGAAQLAHLLELAPHLR